jgi:L-ascorbate metabolism protein UlaG (beta-lactamase superfamily)
MRNSLIITIAILFAACSAHKGKLLQKAGYIEAGDKKISLSTSPQNTIAISYFQCGGICIKSGNDVVLVDPFASNPSVVSKVKTDTAAVGLIMKGINRADIKAILVSHSHYDHLMDVPHIMNTYCPPTTKLFVNHTGVQIAKRLQVDSTKIIDVEHAPGFTNVTNTIRVLPIISSHPPHIGNRKLYDGEYRPKTKPGQKSFWRCGKPYAYLIDIMNGGDVSFRMMVQTSASNEASANLPDSLLKAKAVDVLVMPVALYSKTPGYPASVLNIIKPKYSIIGHWENFFRPYKKLTRKPYQVAGGTDVMAFVKTMEQLVGKDKFRIPMPGTSITIAY